MGNLLRRSSDINTVLGSYLAPGNLYQVNAYAQGAIASGPSTGGVHQVYPGHGFVVGEYAMKGLDPLSVSRVGAVNNNGTEISLDNTSLVSSANTVWVNLGVDANGTTPGYTQTGTPNRVIYSTPTTANTITNSIVICGSDGSYGYWYPSTLPIWELILTPAKVPIRCIIQNSNVLLVSNSTNLTDNLIARYDGTGGLTIQDGYATNAPSINDDGGITAAGTHILGKAGTTTTLLGALTAVQAVTLNGGITATGANTFGATGNMTTIPGSATISQNLTLTGTATFGSTLSAGNSTLLITDMSQISVKGATAPSSTIGLNVSWGTSGTAASAAIVAGGKDNRFTVAVTPRTSGFSGNATVTVTFGTPFTVSAPQGIVVMQNSTGVTAGQLSWTTSLTNIVITMPQNPVAFVHYFSVILIG